MPSLVTLHLISLRRDPSHSPELSDWASLASQLATGNPCLSLPSVGITGGLPSTPTRLYMCAEVQTPALRLEQQGPHGPRSSL